MKRLIASFFAMLFIITVFTVPAFAAESEEPLPGLISERIVTDDEGNTGIIRVYKLDENGEIPGYQTRAARVLYNSSTWVSASNWSTILSVQEVQGMFKDAVNCYNKGTGALTFSVDGGGVDQAVDPGYAVQFIVPKKWLYDVRVKANWSDHDSWIKVTAE